MKWNLSTSPPPLTPSPLSHPSRRVIWLSWLCNFQTASRMTIKCSVNLSYHEQIVQVDWRVDCIENFFTSKHSHTVTDEAACWRKSLLSPPSKSSVGFPEQTFLLENKCARVDIPRETNAHTGTDGSYFFLSSRWDSSLRQDRASEIYFDSSSPLLYLAE